MASVRVRQLTKKFGETPVLRGVDLDIASGQFKSTVFTGSPVKGFTISQGKYYLAAENGLYVYDPAFGNLVEDFSRWEKIMVPGLPAQYTCQAVAEHKGTLYAGFNGDLYKMDQGDFILWYTLEGFTLNFISPEGQNLMNKSRDTFGVVVWPDPGAPGLTAEQSAALVKFHETVKRRAAIAAGNSQVTDAIMTAETDALVKIRAAAISKDRRSKNCVMRANRRQRLHITAI